MKERLTFALRQPLCVGRYEIGPFRECCALARAMQPRFEHRDEFGFGILHAVPRRAKPANRIGEIGPMIKIGKPFFEVAILEVALYFSRLQSF